MNPSFTDSNQMLLMGSQSAVFSASSMGSQSFRNNNTTNSNNQKQRNKKSNFIRSQHFRPHTPTVCNRKNDTEEMILADELIREKTDQRQTTQRALPWTKMSPRFRPKPPSKSAELNAPCCDIGCETYFQDRTTPSSRRKNCVAFQAPSREAPMNTRHGNVTAAEDDEVFGQIRRMENLCKTREFQRQEAAIRLAEAERAVMEEKRPAKTPRGPRQSFKEFEEEMQMYQEAAEWIKKRQEEEEEATKTTCKKEKAAADDRQGKKDDKNDQSSSSLASSTSDNDENEGEDTASSTARNATRTGASSLTANPSPAADNDNHHDKNDNTADIMSNNPPPPSDPHLQKFYYNRVSDYDAVKRLQQRAFGVLMADDNNGSSSSRSRAGGTALRIRNQRSSSAHDPTSFSHPVTPRSKTVRMIDPSSEHGSRTSRGRFKSSSENEIDAIAGADGTTDDFGREKQNSNQVFFGSGHGAFGGGGGGNYCRQAFYDTPVEVFRHVATPRLTPRQVSDQAIKKRNQIEHQRLVAAGKIKIQEKEIAKLLKQNQIDYDLYDDEGNKRDNNNIDGTMNDPEKKKLSLQAAVAAALKKRKKTPSSTTAGVATYALADAPLLRSLGHHFGDDDMQNLYTQIDPHQMNVIQFEKQSGRERRPLSAGAVTHTGFSAGLSFETLNRSDSATAKGSCKMGNLAIMKLPLHEKKGPAQPKLQTNPRYNYVHNRAPSVAFGSPPALRAATILGSPEKMIGKEKSEELAQTKFEPPIRTLGAFMKMNTCFDFREPLDIDKGIQLTHPKSIRDVKMPVMKKKEGEDDA